MRVYYEILFLLEFYLLGLAVGCKLFPFRIPWSPLKITLVPRGFGIPLPCIHVTWIRPYQGTIRLSWGEVHPSHVPSIRFPFVAISPPTNLILLGLLDRIYHAKFCTLHFPISGGMKFDMLTHGKIRKFSNKNMFSSQKVSQSVSSFLIKIVDVWCLALRTYWDTRRYGFILFYFKYKNFQISGVARGTNPKRSKRKTQLRRK